MPPEVLPAVVDALKSESDADTFDALMGVLGASGKPDAWPVIDSHLSDATLQSRGSAQRALQVWLSVTGLPERAHSFVPATHDRYAPVLADSVLVHLDKCPESVALIGAIVLDSTKQEKELIDSMRSDAASVGAAGICEIEIKREASSAAFVYGGIGAAESGKHVVGARCKVYREAPKVESPAPPPSQPLRS